MLSPKTQTNLANAPGYFEEHHYAGDYYAENSRVQGIWIAVGAVLLSLEGGVTREALLSLCGDPLADFFFASYILGSSVVRMFRRSQVRFFRRYRNH